MHTINYNIKLLKISGELFIYRKKHAYCIAYLVVAKALKDCLTQKVTVNTIQFVSCCRRQNSKIYSQAILYAIKVYIWIRKAYCNTFPNK